MQKCLGVSKRGGLETDNFRQFVKIIPKGTVHTCTLCDMKGSRRRGTNIEKKRDAHLFVLVCGPHSEYGKFIF